MFARPSKFRLARFINKEKHVKYKMDRLLTAKIRKTGDAHKHISKIQNIKNQ